MKSDKEQFNWEFYAIFFGIVLIIGIFTHI